MSATIESTAPRRSTEQVPTSADAAGINIESLAKSFRRNDGSHVHAIDGVSLEVGSGEFVVLLGPSGCGKTTLLRAVAGLERPDGGTITVNGRCLFDSARGINVPTEKRGISMVFQSYALWPHMTALQNVAFPLRVQLRASRRRAAELARIALDMVGVGKLAEQYPAQMSGGQQQRVSLARALAPGNRTILFDEPLSNVDARNREGLRREISRMQREIGFSALYVTHDQSEALMMADRVAVMRDGKVVQFDSPTAIYRNPADQYVGEFVGSANMVPGSFAVRAATSKDAGTVTTSIGAVFGRGHVGKNGTAVTALLRPEVLRLSRSEPATGTPNCWRGEVIETVFAGAHVEYVVGVGTLELVAWQAGATLHWDAGDPVWVTIDADDVVILEGSR